MRIRTTGRLPDSLLHPLSTARVPETLGERVVVDFQLGHFLVLIGCHCYELALLNRQVMEGLQRNDKATRMMMMTVIVVTMTMTTLKT